MTQSIKDQKEVTREVNEKLIIDAAEQIFALYGFKGATTDRISKQASLPKANVHYYFKTKSNLYREVLHRILDDWMEAAEDFDTHPDPKSALTNYVISKMKFSRNRPYASKVWANEVLHGAKIAGEFFQNELQGWVQDRTKIVNDWIQQGKIKAVDPETLFFMIWATTQHYADFSKQLEILNDGKAFTDEQYQQKTQQVVRLVLNAVGIE